MAEPLIETKEEKMQEGAAFVTLYMDVKGKLRMNSQGVGAYTLVGWFRLTLKQLENQLLGGKPS